MSYLNISLVGAIAIFGAAIGIEQSRSLPTDEQTDASGFSTLIAMQSVPGLPVQDFDDRSLVFPRETGR
jgi:hypothetical protein